MGFAGGFWSGSSAPPASAGGVLVWEWNRLDTSQFEGAAAFADGGGTATLSVASQAERGNVLRMTGTAGVSACVAWLVNDPIPFQTTRRDLLIEVEVFSVTPTNKYGGIVVLADDAGSYHGMHHYFASSEYSSLVEAGVRSTPGGTGSGFGINSGLMRYHIRGSKPAGAPPNLTSWQDGIGAVAATGRARAAGNNLTAINPFGAAAGTLAASWNNLACDRWGITLQTAGGGALDQTLDILDLRLYVL